MESFGGFGGARWERWQLGLLADKEERSVDGFKDGFLRDTVLIDLFVQYIQDSLPGSQQVLRVSMEANPISIL